MKPSAKDIKKLRSFKPAMRLYEHFTVTFISDGHEVKRSIAAKDEQQAAKSARQNFAVDCLKVVERVGSIYIPGQA